MAVCFSPKSRRLYLAVIPIIILVILITAYLWPENFPMDEAKRISNDIVPYDAVIIYNGGGAGNAALEHSQDFLPVLRGIQQTLTDLGYHPTIIAYTRTPSDFSGRITDIKEFLTGYDQVSKIQAKDLEYLARSFPGKRILLVGFSNGGGLTDRTMRNLGPESHIDSIMAGVPFWFPATLSPTSLVLNNQGQDPLAARHLKEMAVGIVKAPFRWVWAKITGKNLSLALAFEFPGHAYPWTSPEVGPPILQFLQTNFKK